MANALTSSSNETLADLVDRLGGIPLDRIRYRPLPGTATEQDVVRTEEDENRLCELVEGVLVEKPMGFRESLLAMAIGNMLRNFVVPANLGVITGADGMMRLFAGLVRIPDVAYIAWDHLPGRQVPAESIPNLAPDLAVEILSRTNTPREMERKRQEYFDAGVSLVWIVDPDLRMVTAFTDPNTCTVCHESDVLDGGTVLPGLRIALADIFAELDRTGP
jgi:Uma2 family endonuclease